MNMDHSSDTKMVTTPLPLWEGQGGRSIIAVAKDSAFNFTYRANIDSLRELSEIVFFSPLVDEIMPECDLLYLPGGYPELFASDLANNASMRESIKAFAENGGRIFAECGGFMYLCNDIDGIPMCGVFPFSATMMDAKLHLGYRQLDNCQFPKGHEFHYSSVIEPDTLPEGIRKEQFQSSAKNQPVDTALYHYKNVLAGYTHWYWAETGFSKIMAMFQGREEK
jgi:cobyrinic acid a,c-diamide synthase